LFNNYADQAGYCDICLLIYYAADHRNPTDVLGSWQQLLENTHEEALERRKIEPYEAVANIVRTLGKRLNLSESTFPVSSLILLLERYAFEFQRGVGSPHWVADLFLDLQVPNESIFFALETIFYANEAPFRGSNRKAIANDMLHVAQRWFHDTSRGKGTLFGSESNAAAMLTTLQTMMQNGLTQDKIEECQALRLRIDYLMR
jgi:nuclear pore complex protein Nup155